MRGCITKRKGGWAFVVELGKDSETGRRRQKWFSGFSTKQEAETALANKLTEMNQGMNIEVTNQLTSEYLQKFLDFKMNQVRPGTWKSYRWLILHRIIPLIGSCMLSKLSPQHFEQLYVKLLNGKEALSRRSVLHAHRLLFDAMSTAVRWRLILQNPVALVKPPRPKRLEMKIWDENQLRHFLATSKSDNYFIGFLLAATTGARMGEVLALRWTDIDFDHAKLSIHRSFSRGVSGHEINETKTAAGNRNVSLPSALLQELRSHRVKQLEYRLLLGNEYKDAGLILQTKNGTPIGPRNFSRNWYKQLKRSGLPPIRFHDLRHTHASILLKQGVHAKVVSERLGHSSIQLTLDTYSHLLPGMQEEAAEKFGTIILG